MTSTSNTKRRLLQQRLNEIVQHSGELLELSDLKALSVAIAEAAADAIKQDAVFAQKVCKHYKELANVTSPAPHTGMKGQNEGDDLVPIKAVAGHDVGIVAPLDPYFLQELYGDAQLPKALKRYTLKHLLEGAALVERKHPGTKPANKTKKDAVIAYIINYINA